MSGGLFDIPAALRGRVCTAAQAAAMIPEGAVVAASGYTGAGDPKTVLAALAERGRAGDIHHIDLIAAAQLGQGTENALAESGILRRRAPFTQAGQVRRLANGGGLHYVEVPMARMPRLFAAGAFDVPDAAIIEVMGVGADGRVTLTTSVGMSDLLCARASKIILEVNTAQPECLAGVHDIYISPAHAGRSLDWAGERVGAREMVIDLSRVAAVVYADTPDEAPVKTEPTGQELAICRNLFDFLGREYPGRSLPPVQTGIGGLSRAILSAFRQSDYRDIEFFCGALQEDMLELLAAGKAKTLSGGSVVTTPEARRAMEALGAELPEHLVLRSMEVCNGTAAASSLGILSLNTGVEMDIFGNVNASHIMGRQVVNGIGGGASFAASAGLSVMLLPSVRKNGAISCFVPQTPNVDVVHHDVDVVVSEWGAADLRGKDDAECARAILETCVHPDYRAQMAAELERAIALGGHRPVSTDDPYSWHRRLQETGTMKLD